MEKAEFIVDTPEWKSFYKMSYDGRREKFLAFSSLVNGTILFKLGTLYPELQKAVDSAELEGLEEFVKELKSAAKKVVKSAEIEKDYRQFAEMWATAALLNRLGLKVAPDRKEVKKVVKKI